MSIRTYFQQAVSQVSSTHFEALALEIFRWQARQNSLYHEYLTYLKVNPYRVESLRQVPFLPIGFFKRHQVITATARPKLIFESSGTTGSQTSRHYVADPTWYQRLSVQLFEATYGRLDQFHVLALLPSYLERNNSSLVYMVQHFIDQSASPASGFYLRHTASLLDELRRLITQPDHRKILLWGVTFALLDLVESEQDLSFLRHAHHLIVMETGGMKGRRREMLREEVHKILTQSLGVAHIHSEYGMTELLSQVYSQGEGIFETSATLRILLRDINDPRTLFDHPHRAPRYGGINVVDLGNLDSCCFVETHDLGRYVGDTPHRFEVIGRFDNTDVRGCNLLIQ